MLIENIQISKKKLIFYLNSDSMFYMMYVLYIVDLYACMFFWVPYPQISDYNNYVYSHIVWNHIARNWNVNDLNFSMHLKRLLWGLH